MTPAIRAALSPANYNHPSTAESGLAAMNPASRPWTEAEIRADLADWQARELADWENREHQIEYYPNKLGKAVEQILDAWQQQAIELDLSDLRLHTLPASIGQLTALQTLSLGWNRLQTLPHSFGRLTALRSLKLCWNHFTTLPCQRQCKTDPP